MTTVRNLKDEIDKRAFHKMLSQPWKTSIYFDL